MKQDRPQAIADRDLGCSEYPDTTVVEPIATESNTGPHYDTSTATSLQSNHIIVNDLIQVAPNPVSDVFNVTLTSPRTADVIIEVMDINGSMVGRIASEGNFSGLKTYTRQLGALPAGIYTIHASSRHVDGGVNHLQSIKVVKY